MNTHSEHGTTHGAATGLEGLSLSAGGYVLSPVTAPEVAGTAGRLSFQIRDTAGAPVRAYHAAHEKELHLIVVRSDGARFRHVHPELDRTTGTWSLPWEWAEAGAYRMYVDFTPAGDNTGSVTLTRSVQVGGTFDPAVRTPKRVDDVGGFTVSLDGELVAGSHRDLRFSVTRGGRPVTTLQPYLGAFGHLVALREGDLAYLHIHAEGAEPNPGDTAGPDIGFMAVAPTAGRYLLYLDFQVDGTVHTAEFVLDAAPGAQTGTASHHESPATSGHRHAES